MPLVTGTFKDQAEAAFVGTVFFENLDAPASGGSFLVSTGQVSVNTLSDGTLPADTHLAPGRTRFTINGRQSKVFVVPETGPYDISALMETPSAFVAGSIDARLIEIVAAEGYQLTAINYDSDGVVTTATVTWPDGTSGTFTTTSKNSTFLAIDAYTITYSAANKTVTQSAITRDSSGNVTVKPALTVS